MNKYFNLLHSIFLITSLMAQSKDGRIPLVNYHKAMSNSYTYEEHFAKNNIHWQRVKFLFDNLLRDNEEKSFLRIPKIIHQIWIGGMLPEKCKKFQETWIKYNPDWEYHLWTEEDIKFLNLVNKKKYDEATNYGEKADIARYEILYRYGGVYVDTDFECLKSFDALHYQCDFYAGVAYDKEFIVFNGLIGSLPAHPILRNCIEKLFSSPYNPEGVMSRTGPYFFTERILEHIHSQADRTILFPVSYFYPWPNNNLKRNSRRDIEQWFKPETYAVHHWHRSWCN